MNEHITCFLYICTYLHVYVYTYVLMYIRTYLHMYIHNTRGTPTINSSDIYLLTYFYYIGNQCKLPRNLMNISTNYLFNTCQEAHCY